MSWLKIKKIIILKCLLLLYATTTNHFSIRLWYVMKSGFYITTRNSQLSGWTEKKLQSTSQSQTCTKKKRSWSLFGGLLPVWSTTAFWILTKPLYLRSMLCKSMRCTENRNAGSRHRSTEKGPILLQDNAWPHVAHPILQKLKESGYRVLPPLPHSPVLSPSLLQTPWQLLARKMLPQPAGCRICFPRVRWILKIFTLQE